MSLWSQVLSAALVGTDRRPAPTVPAESPLALPLSGGPGPEHLLEVAATVTVARRAASPAEHGVALPAAAPAESVPQVPPAAAARLRTLLSASARGGSVAAMDQAALLTEWLSLAGALRLRVPGALLPDLLDQARPDLRPMVAAVGGERAVWLAGLQPRWSWLVTESTVDDETLWHEGTTPQRVSYLAGLRTRDAGRARELLVEAWPAQPPAERASLLSTLEHGLSAADEPVCEGALDDRRKEVRTAAQALLAALPDSAYRRRMADRAQPCVAVDETGALVVTPPSECDRAMRRDGIEPKPPQGTGERAWWFEQIVARTPLAVWRELEPDPAALLGRPVADGWDLVLHQAWAQATVAQHDPVWASALVRGDSPLLRRALAHGRVTAQATGGSAAAAATEAALIRAVYQQLTAADAVEVAVTLLEADSPHAEQVLPGCPRPWPPRLVTAAMARLGRMEQTGMAVYRLTSLAGLGLPPTQAAAVQELAERRRLDQPGIDDDSHLDGLARTLTLRHQMHREFE